MERKRGTPAAGAANTPSAAAGTVRAAETAATENGEPTAAERFDDLCSELVGLDGVTPPRGGGGFGRGALRYEGRIFAMLVRDALVLKLPAARVDALLAAGEGERFDANKGTPMREWFRLAPSSPLAWKPLAVEALDFARAAGGAAVRAR